MSVRLKSHVTFVLIRDSDRRVLDSDRRVLDSDSLYLRSWGTLKAPTPDLGRFPVHRVIYRGPSRALPDRFLLISILLDVSTCRVL